MISRVMSAELAEHAGQRVTIAGWVHRRRRLKSVSFLIVRDRAGLAQAVTAHDLPPEESVVQVTGTVAASEQAPGGYELVSPRVEVLAEPADGSRRAGISSATAAPSTQMNAVTRNISVYSVCSADCTFAV